LLFVHRGKADARRSIFMREIQKKGMPQNQIDSQRPVKKCYFPRAELQLCDNAIDEDVLGEIIAKENTRSGKIGKQKAICKNMGTENITSAKRPCFYMHHPYSGGVEHQEQCENAKRRNEYCS
jgi:hypothetical protein